MITSAQCSICLELSQPERTVVAAVDGSRGRVLASAADWVLMPSLGPLHKHHLLLLPRSHYRSIAYAWRKLDRESFAVLLALAHTELDTAPALVFEHGEPEIGGSRAGACIDHAHLHILPGMGGARDRAMRELHFETSHQKFEQAMLEADLDGYHLLGILGGQTEIELRTAVGPSPSQFLRRLVGAAVGAGDSWDWRSDWNLAAVEHTCRVWRGASDIVKTETDPPLTAGRPFKL
jgi:diadenosine tetraphosphate (Ap4A) HIT family hydrolase